MKKLVEKYCELPRNLRKPLWRVLHTFLQKFDTEQDQVFLNYGFHSENGIFKDLHLEKPDLSNRYGIQLYNYVAQSKNLRNSRILEVGCGRGGGAEWLARTSKPKSYIAMDISKSAIEFCRNHHDVPGLKFIKGEASNIPFPDSYFDTVINIESARCYSSIKKFFQEVGRVLRPKSHFLFADMIKKSNVEKVNTLLLKSGFNLLKGENITKNISLALKGDSKSRKLVIDQNVPGLLRPTFYEFAGIEGSNRFNIFLNGQMEYWSFVLEKR